MIGPIVQTAASLLPFNPLGAVRGAMQSLARPVNAGQNGPEAAGADARFSAMARELNQIAAQSPAKSGAAAAGLRGQYEAKLAGFQEELNRYLESQGLRPGDALTLELTGAGELQTVGAPPGAEAINDALRLRPDFARDFRQLSAVRQVLNDEAARAQRTDALGSQVRSALEAYRSAGAAPSDSETSANRMTFRFGG